ncbi:hypothetical protein KR074_011388, partial [Drosophila pseudoananassae]
ILLHYKICDPLIIYKTTNIECTTTPKYSTNATCRLKAINWNKTVANMDMDFVRPMNNISIRFQVFRRDSTNQFQPFLIDVTINMCDFILRRNYSPYGKIVWNLVRAYSNFNHSCPYKVNKIYILREQENIHSKFQGHLFARDIYIDEKFMIIALPLGIYKFTVTVLENFINKPTEYAGTINIYAQAMIPVKLKR